MTASDLLQIAAGELGVTENPPKSNKVKYNTWYYGKEVSGSSYPWCMVFVQWVFNQAKVALPVKTASCGALMRAAQQQGSWITSGYQPGDVVVYDFPGGASTDHCGIVEKVESTGVVSLEGNTGSGDDADGGQVQRRTRPNKYIVGAFRPDFEEEEMRYNTISECPKWAQPTIKKLVNKEYLGGSGSKDAQGNPTDLDLTMDMIRVLMINDKAGLYD